MQAPIILHHYQGSPFAHKIVWALTIKKLQWISVTLPSIPPRPLLQPLTHGYRRIPVLQIGSDVFIDTILIMEELERRYPEPTLFPKRNGTDKSDKGLGLSISIWTDRHLFPTMITLSFSSKNPATPKLLTSKEFIEDRGSLIGTSINLEKLSNQRPYLIDQIRSSLEWIELQFSEDNREWFLDTPYPSIADIHIAAIVWFLHVFQVASELVNSKSYPKTLSWLNRFTQYIKMNEIKPKRISGEEALEIAKKFQPFDQGKMKIEQDQKDTRRKLGDNVMILPDDYGKIPVKGKIVSLGDRRIGIRPHDIDKTGIEVVIWFPRAGYTIKPDNSFGKL